MLRCHNCDSHIDSTSFGFCSKDCSNDSSDLPGLCDSCSGTGIAYGGYCVDCGGVGTCQDLINDYS